MATSGFARTLPRMSLRSCGLQLTEYRFRGHQIEMPAAGVLEERDVGVRPAARNRAADQIVHVAEHVAFPDCSAGDRAQDIADAVEGRLATVGENDRAPCRVVVRLARRRIVAADQVEMRPGSQQRSLDQRRVGAGAVVMTSALTTVASRSSTASASIDWARRLAAVSTARWCVLFQM